MKRATNVSATHIMHTQTKPLNTKLNIYTFMFVLKGAAIAKKKMMKKFGWYKHSEDGGGTLKVSVVRRIFM